MPTLHRILPTSPNVPAALRGAEVELLEVLFPCEDRCGAWWCQVRRPGDGHQLEVLSSDIDPDPIASRHPADGAPTAARFAQAFATWARRDLPPAPRWLVAAAAAPAGGE